MGNGPIIEFKGEDWIFLDFEKDVFGSEGIKTMGEAAELGPFAMNQVTVSNIDEIKIMSPRVGD